MRCSCAYRVVGEIMYAHGDKVGGEVTVSGERYIDPLGAGSDWVVVNALALPSQYAVVRWHLDVF